MYNLEQHPTPAYQIKTFKINGEPDILKLHDFKHFEKLLQSKYKKITTLWILR